MWNKLGNNQQLQDKWVSMLFRSELNDLKVSCFYHIIYVHSKASEVSSAENSV